MSQFFKSSAEKALFLAWLVMQGLLFYHYGIITDLEARKYIAEADNLLKTGTVSSPNFWLYSTQIFLIAAAMKLKTGFLSVALVQLFFNGWATYSFYKLASNAGNKLIGFILALLLICNYPLQTFNTSLQTESLFYSLTILFSCYLLQLQSLTIKSFITIFLLLIIIFFTRPSGLLFIPCTFLYLFFRFKRSVPLLLKTGIAITVLTGFLFLLNSVLGSGGALDFMLPFRNESLICGVPTLSHFQDIKTSENPNSVFGLLYYITHNFDQFIRLAWLRSKVFFGLFRSYYSTGHNIYLGLYFFPVYLLAILSLRSWMRRNGALLLYCLSLIAVTWGTVILTCDDWHNRFLLAIAPYIYILAIPALQQVTNKLKGNKGK